MNAESYSNLGYGVLPLQPGGKAPVTKNGLKDATTDSAIIKSWPAHHNVGILPPERVLVLDADSPEEVKRLEHDYPELLTAPRCDTPSGGAHFYLRLPDGATAPKTTVRVRGRSLDTRGLDKAYLVAPPSALPSGKYEWKRPLVSPDELPEASPALIELLSPPQKNLSTPPEVLTLQLNGRGRYASAALQAEHDNVASAPEGSRNHALNTAAYSLGQLVGSGALDRTEVEGALRSAAATCGLEPRETEATLKSGLDAGTLQPREVPRPSVVPPSVQPISRAEPSPELTAAQEHPPEAEEPWNDLTPLPGLYPPVPSLPTDLVPEPLRAWAVDIAERSSLPLEYVACPAIVAVGATIGRRVGVHPKRYDDWLVVPNLWGGIVGRPGVMKTAAISEATKPLRALAAAAQERYQAEAAQAEAEKARLELEIAALKENAKRDAKKRSKP